MSEVKQTPDKQETANAIDEGVDGFIRLVRQAGDLEAPRAVGEWSIRDMLAHIVAWHEEALWALQSTVEGTYERRDYSDVDRWNSAAIEQYEGLTGLELLERAGATGHEIAAKVRELPDELWEQKPRLSTWPHATTIRHYREHEDDLVRAFENPA